VGELVAVVGCDGSNVGNTTGQGDAGQITGVSSLALRGLRISGTPGNGFGVAQQLRRKGALYYLSGEGRASLLGGSG